MTSAEFRALEPYFHAALDIPAGEGRARYLESCPAELRSHLGRLIHAYELQERPENPPAAPLPRWGPYQAETVLGSGGSGIVYLACRADGEFHHRVALKVLRSVARTEGAIARFRKERQILAHLQHPHIAALFDGGLTPEGEPCVVMEYVEGLPLDRHSDERRLSIRARIDLIQQLLAAVDYLHQNLLVHGDLKPSNVLVTRDGMVKVVDFGTSRFVDDDATMTGGLTALTPRFASPEQIRGERLTTASDIYSLGIQIYELIVGASPFGPAASLLSTLERAVHEQAPRPPSSVVTAEAAAVRGVSERELRSLFAGDLGGVLVKAIAHDPAARYRSVAELSSDLTNFSQGLPVRARRQTAVYRARKFIQRHKLPVAASAAAILALAWSTAYALLQQRSALAEARHAKAMNGFLIRLFQSTNPMYGGRADLTLPDLIARSAQLADRMLADEPLARSEFEISLASHYLIMGMADPQALDVTERAVQDAQRAGDPAILAESMAVMADANAIAGRCDVARGTIARSAAIVQSKPARISREWRIAITLNENEVAGLCGGARPGLKQDVLEAARLSSAIADDSREEATPPRVLKSMSLLQASAVAGCASGEPYRRRALAIAQGDATLDGVRSEVLNAESDCLVAEGSFAAARALLLQSLNIRIAVFGADSGMTRLVRARLAYVQANVGDRAAAVQQAHAAMQSQGSRSTALEKFVNALSLEGLLLAGREREVIEIAPRLTNDPRIGLIAKAVLFTAYRELHQPEQAAPYRAAAQTWVKALGPGLWRDKLTVALQTPHTPYGE